MADVVLVDLALRWGGAEKRVLQLATGLATSGITTTVVCLGQGALATKLAQEGLSYVALPYGRGDPRAVVALIRILRQERPQVVDAHNVQSQLWSMLACLGSGPKKRVATVHSEYRWSEGGTALRGRAYEGVLRLLARAGWSYVAVTDSVGRYLATLGIGVTTVWSAVEPVLPDPSRNTVVRGELGLSADDFVVVCVARLVPAKDHKVLLEAVAEVVQELPRLQVLLVGDGPLEQELRDQQRSLGLDRVVRFLGRRDDVEDLLGASDLCVLTSRTEGLPYALLEAVAVGTPVLSTNVGAIPSLLVCGRDAELVEPGCPDQVARGLTRAYAQPAAWRERAGRARRGMETRGGAGPMVEATRRAYDMGDVLGRAVAR